MRIKGKFVVRKIADEIVALPTGNDALHFSGIISLNEVGEFLFQLLGEEQDLNSMIRAVVSEYEVDEQTAAADIADFLAVMRQNDLLDE